MLKGIDPLLGPDLLRLLAQMGHGDVLAVVDRNFPAHSTVPDRVCEAPDSSVDDVVRAVLSVFPLDAFVEAPIGHMLMDDGGEGPALPGVRALADAAESRAVPARGIRRAPDFYREAADAYAAVRTGETRPYACFLFTKGVV